MKQYGVITGVTVSESLQHENQPECWDHSVPEHSIKCLSGLLAHCVRYTFPGPLLVPSGMTSTSSLGPSQERSRSWGLLWPIYSKWLWPWVQKIFSVPPCICPSRTYPSSVCLGHHKSARHTHDPGCFWTSGERIFFFLFGSWGFCIDIWVMSSFV